MIRRAAVGSVLLLAVSTVTVSAGGPPVVQMLSSSFSPAVVSIVVGESVTWNNDSGVLHTTTANKFNQWDRTVPAGSDENVPFARAGTWTYFCEIHSDMTGKVKVAPTASPASGTTATAFLIRVATVNPPASFVEDIQRRKGSKSFRLWTSTSNQTVSWTPGSSGTWQVRARLRKTSNGATTGWSQPLTVVVN